MSGDAVLSLERRHNGQSLVVAGSLAAQLAQSMSLRHVYRLADDVAILEHAEGAIGRREHGYCTDDVARQLLVASLFGRDGRSEELSMQALTFLRHALLPNGRLRSRMNYAREWIDDGASDDAVGRALWGLGVAIAETRHGYIRDGATRLFHQVSGFRSDHWHATAYSVLGASSLLSFDPHDERAMAIMVDGASALQQFCARSLDPVVWPWPQLQVTYSAGALPDALMALAVVDPSMADDGLALLRWLARRSVIDGHLSVFPASGFTDGDVLPAFDQQPIEAQALASAAWRAFTFTRDVEWLELLVRCAAWFVGHNDAHVALYDPQTGGCCDGLQADSRNENQGAESTLAMLQTFALSQQALAEGAIHIVATIDVEDPIQLVERSYA